jgi:hypothetical protein
MLELRLDTGLDLAAANGAVDQAAVRRLERVGLVRRARADGHDRLVLTPLGRRLGGAVTAELVV